MSDSVRPHRRQLTRLPCLWDSPGKNSGVGCHFLLQCMNAWEVASVVSDSVWPHGQQPTRLLCPWNSPGKSTGVGCHFLIDIQCCINLQWTTLWLHLHTLINYHHNKFSEYPLSDMIQNKRKRKKFPMWKELLGFTLLTNFVYNTQQCNYISDIAHYIPHTYLSYN